jgi:hypothetical protein
MPYDLQVIAQPTGSSLRDEILELISRKSLDPAISEQQYRAALRTIVTCSRDNAENLWDKYRGSEADTRAAIYARYGY